MAIISLPVGVLNAFIVMRFQGINANIMSLGGISIGVIADAAVVMIKNAHKKIEAWHVANPGEELKGDRHWNVMTEAAAEVGPALFFCLLIITMSFIPVFTLETQEGRLFGLWLRRYRTRRSVCRVWRDHAALPEERLGRI